MHFTSFSFPQAACGPHSQEVSQREQRAFVRAAGTLITSSLLDYLHGRALLRARTYKANGEWAVRDFCCDCFSVLDQETKNELSSRSAEGRRCRLARR
eukprot:4170878-Prymnesium_polylepis.1